MKQETDPAVEALARSVSQVYAMKSVMVANGINKSNFTPEHIMLLQDEVDVLTESYMEIMRARAAKWIQMIDRIRYNQISTN